MPGAHLRRTVEVQPHLAVLDRDLNRHVERTAEFGAVIGIREAIGAVRQRRDTGTHLALGIIPQCVADREHGVGAVFPAHRLHPLHAQSVCRYLRAQVRQPLSRQLAIEQDRLLHVLLQFTGAIEPDGRNAEPFLVDAHGRDRRNRRGVRY